jgi:TatD DNase family protein
MFFDTHAHYDDEAFDTDRDSVLAGLPAKGIGAVIDPGCTLTSSRTAVALAEKYAHVYAAVGIHPENCGDFTPGDMDTLRELARHPKVVAIGEVGLDYYWEGNPPRQWQQDVLCRQMALAQELDLPVIFHDREAHGDSQAAVKAHPGVRGVFHCYSGSAEDAATLLRLGWMVSFNGAITFKNARKAPQIIEALPLERIMIETDAPYLTPVPHRGERNDSSYVPLVAERIAQIKHLTVDEVERVTAENGRRFFRIP